MYSFKFLIPWNEEFEVWLEEAVAVKPRICFEDSNADSVICFDDFKLNSVITLQDVSLDSSIWLEEEFTAVPLV